MKSSAVPSPVSSSTRGSPSASPCEGAWHTGRAREGKAAHGCPKDTQSPHQSFQEKDFPSCWALLCSLTIQALLHSVAASYPRGKWFTGKQILPAG